MKLVYVHGFGSSSQSSTAKTLAELTDMEVVAVDYDYENPPRAVQQLEEQLSAIDDTVILVGSSLGGYFARWLANKRPDKVSGLVLINPSLDAPESTKKYIGAKNPVNGNPLNITEAYPVALAEYAVEKDSIDLPIFLIVGMQDKIVPPQNALNVYEGRAEIMQVNDGHRIALNNDIVEEIELFVSHAEILCYPGK